MIGMMRTNQRIDMGYQTDLDGAWKVTPPMSPEHIAYINKFTETRRMKRDVKKAALLPDPIREAVGLPIGYEGQYFVGGTGYAGQDRDASIIEYNEQPTGQPGLWCKWEVSKDGTTISWNGCEKFYDYVEWIQYLIDNFLTLWGYTLNGSILWQGEEIQDRGEIVIKDNVVNIR